MIVKTENAKESRYWGAMLPAVYLLFFVCGYASGLR